MFEDLLSSYLMEGNRLEEIRKYKGVAKTILDIVPAGICSPDQMEKHFNFYADYYGTFGSSLPLLSVHQEVVLMLARRFGIFPENTKRKVLRDWAASEGATIRGAAAYGLTLAKRAVGARSAKVLALKQIIRQTVKDMAGAPVDTDAVIDLAVQDIAKDQETMAESVQGSDVDMADVANIEDLQPFTTPLKSSLQSLVTPPPSELKVQQFQDLSPAAPADGPVNFKLPSPDNMETQAWDLNETEMPLQPPKCTPQAEDRRQATQESRGTVESVPAILPSTQEQNKLLDAILDIADKAAAACPRVDLAKQQLKMAEIARKTAAKEKVDKQTAKEQKELARVQKLIDKEEKTQAKAKATCRKGGKKKTTETEEQAEPAGNAESSVAPAESSARAAPPSASSADQGARWFAVGKELEDAGVPVPLSFDGGSRKSFSIKGPPGLGSISILWDVGAIYVMQVVNSNVNDGNGDKVEFAVNKKSGCNISAKKFGGWGRAWSLARLVAGW